MKKMFYGCKLLSSADFRNGMTFDEGALASTNTMEEMFNGCSVLGDVLFSDTYTGQNVTSFKNVYEDCAKLSTVEMRNFNVSNVTTMDSMFLNCSTD